MTYLRLMNSYLQCLTPFFFFTDIVKQRHNCIKNNDEKKRDTFKGTTITLFVEGIAEPVARNTFRVIITSVPWLGYHEIDFTLTGIK